MLARFLNKIGNTPRTRTKVTALVLPLACVSTLPLLFLFYEEFLSDYFMPRFSMTEYRLYSQVNKYLIWWLLFVGPVVILLAQRHWRVLSKWSKRITLTIILITLPFELLVLPEAYVIAFGSRVSNQDLLPQAGGQSNDDLQIISQYGGGGSKQWVDFFVQNHGEDVYQYHVDFVDHTERDGVENRVFFPCPDLYIVNSDGHRIALPECLRYVKIDDYSNNDVSIAPGERKFLYRWHLDKCLRERFAFAGEDFVCVKKKRVSSGSYQTFLKFNRRSQNVPPYFVTRAEVNFE